MTSLKLQLSKATLWKKNCTETEPSFKLRIRAGADSVVWGLSLPAVWTVSQLWLAWVGKTIHWHPRKGQWWNESICISQSLRVGFGSAVTTMGKGMTKLECGIISKTLTWNTVHSEKHAKRESTQSLRYYSLYLFEARSRMMLILEA